MRHYLGYDINGSLASIEAFGPVGWPADARMEDSENDVASVTSLRESRAVSSPGIVNWVLFDCPCDPGQGDLLKNCVCVPSKFAESFVDTATKTLKPKPMRTVYIDGEVVSDQSVITRDPGTTMTLKVASNLMPDGEIVNCVQKGIVDLTLDDEWELTFAAGETDTKTLVAPAQGSRGAVAIGGRLVRPLVFFVRGFVVPE